MTWLLACVQLAPTCDGEAVTLYADTDGDGVGGDNSALVCPGAVGFVSPTGDCDDGDPALAPGQVDVPYDGIDQDCDGQDTCDVDGDGSSSTRCDGGDDCDDGDASVFVGAADPWYDGVDSDCAGNSDYDADGDGYDSAAEGQGTADDCDDTDPSVSPGAEESWYDGVDQDCDGANDYDQDADGYATDDWAELAGLPGGDCDDTRAEATPAGEEVCDGLDNDCDGAVDEGFDGDGDGYSGCGGDCDDDDATVFPGAEEACDGLDEDCDLVVDNGFDEDADGVTTCAGDCDDTDAAVFPGASQVWYDGVDQDCLGDDDFDQDGDGVAYPADCDDTDAGVFPGAEEVPYDGVDDDCDGTDLGDVDGDGFDAQAVGGEDCDDEDASVYPGARDTWYDGVDSDCAGNSDYDQDGDRYDAAAGGGDDCDDTDDTVYPGAPDTWYDGVDSDCVGNSDYDQDGDGYDSEAEGEGTADDCDDTDTSYNPGAADVLDGADQDCSGTADDPDVDAVAGYSVVGDSGDEAGSGGLRLWPDLDGDGESEVIVTSPTVDVDGGAAWLLGPSELSAAGSVNDAYLAVTGASGGQVGAAAALLDWDDDGATDVVLGAPGVPAAYVVDVSAAGSGTRAATAVSWAVVSGTAGDDLGAAAAAGDLDGDGVSDLVLGAPGASSGKGRVYVFYGGASAGSVAASAADYSFPGADSGDAIGSVLASGADHSGDGLDDLVLGVPNDDENSRADSGSAFLLRGSSLLLNPLDQSVESVASWTLTGSKAGEQVGASVALGDLASSSNADVLVGAPGYAWSGGDGGAGVFYGSSSGTESFTAADRLLRADGGGSAVGGGADLDGDGNPDVLLGAADASVVWLLTLAGSSGTLSFPGDELASWWGTGGLGGVLDASSLDIDGDATDDVLLGAPDGAGTAWLVPLFP